MNKSIISSRYKLIYKQYFCVRAVDLPPVFLYTPTQGDLLAHLRAHWVGQDDLCQISLDGADPSACGQRADVDHQNLVLGQLLDLRGHKHVGPVSQRPESTRSAPAPPQQLSPWRPSCLPRCGPPAASGAGSRKSPAR